MPAEPASPPTSSVVLLTKEHAPTSETRDLEHTPQHPDHYSRSEHPVSGNKLAAGLGSQTSIQHPGTRTLDFKPRRRRGPQSKIAQLSGEQRNLVNQLLDEDKTYEKVVEEMARHRVSLTTDNVFKWFNGPYQDYLTALDWRDELQQLRDHAFSFGQEEGSVRFQEGLVQIGLTQIFRAMKEDRFKDDPANTLRLFNSLARLSREALVIRKYANQQSKEKVQELRKLDLNRKMNEVEETAMQDKSDDFFGWKSADRIKREMASASLVRTDSTPSLASTPTPVRTDSTPSPNVGPNPDRDPALALALAPAGTPPSPVAPFGFSNIPSTPQPKGLPEGSRESQSPETPGDVPPNPLHPDGMPDSPDHSSPSEHLLMGSQLVAALGSQSSIQHPESGVSNPPLQNSTTPPLQSPEPCYACGVPLPPLLPNGQRPSNTCIGCSVRLYPPGTIFDHCPVCEDFAPILPGGERVSDRCLRCGQTLPPPGQRFVARCPGCGLALRNMNADGQLITQRCRDCRTLLPLLEPVPPAAQPLASTAA